MKIYIEHKIKSEKDLPEIDNNYIVHHKTFGWFGLVNWKNFENANYPEYNQYLWLLNYDFWLEEKEIPDWEEIEKMIKNISPILKNHFILKMRSLQD